MLEADDLTPDFGLEEVDQEAVTQPTEQPAQEDEQSVKEGKTKSRAGRPLKEIDIETVIKLARLHVTTNDIARWFGVDKNTISARFAHEIEQARAETRARLRRKMLQEAMETGNVTMLIWLSKNMCQMSDQGPTDEDSLRPLPWQD
jgi:hypothetical protein